jgi:hypothetical protein
MKNEKTKKTNLTNFASKQLTTNNMKQVVAGADDKRKICPGGYPGL